MYVRTLEMCNFYYRKIKQHKNSDWRFILANALTYSFEISIHM